MRGGEQVTALMIQVKVVLYLASVLVGLSSCEVREQTPSPAVEPVAVGSLAIAPARSDPVDPCLQEAERLRASEQLEGAVEFQKNRAEILARARSVPVVFMRAPRADAKASRRILQFRKLLHSSKRPAHDIQEVLRKTRRNYEERQAIFLSEGYFYAETPLVALRLSQIIRLDHLFRDETLHLQRGDEHIEVTRQEGRYWLPGKDTSPSQKKRPGNGGLASLLLFDRVRPVDGEFSPRLDRDLRKLRDEHGFSRARVVAKTANKWVFDLNTYGVESRAVVSVSAEGKLALECESPMGATAEQLKRARALYIEDRAFSKPVLAAAREIISRRLPFDEPRTEEGQQDGLLRIHFRKAYRTYRNKYEFNGDEYYVFDGYGRPRIPEVCIDFITDSFDWGTGGRWPNRGEKRLQVRGALNFSSMGIENPRSVENLAEFASETPEWFEMRWVPKQEQVKFRSREKFFAELLRTADEYRIGDVVFIYGLRDDGKFHYHSFFVGQKDPLTGIPTVVLANAGPPQARSWEGEMHNAPLRKIVARMRVRREIFREAEVQAKNHPGEPLEPPAPRAQDNGPLGEDSSDGSGDTNAPAISPSFSRKVPETSPG